jgi:hypothetical protein
VVFAKACELGLEGIVSKDQGSLCRSEPRLAQDQEPEFRQDVTRAALSVSDDQRGQDVRSRLSGVRPSITFLGPDHHRQRHNDRVLYPVRIGTLEKEIVFGLRVLCHKIHLNLTAIAAMRSRHQNVPGGSR